MILRALLILVITVSSILAVGTAGAATYRVPSEYADIQAGIAAASEGDTVLVAPGTYTGANNKDISFGGINIVVISEAGAEATIIDCEGSGSAFIIYEGEDSTSVISGFTVTNGSGGNGGGIVVSGAATIIENCIISNNVASMNGGGMYYGYAPTQGYIRNCIFFGNSCPFRGGGLECDAGYDPYVPVIISGCVFYGNEASTGASYGGGAIYSNGSRVLITGCTITGNAGNAGAGGIHAFETTITVRNSIIAFNTGSAGMTYADVDHCIHYGNEGTDTFSNASPDNLITDPLFCDRTSWILTLCNNSPCLAGSPTNPWGEHVGTYGAACEDCVSGTEERSWGSIKRMGGR
jgi:parallel beta-helix repeat protein